tara:strand:+ start:856 stop:1662 length:807 start_codon:yes stop_codon:yes gene_type:complete
MSKLSSRDDIIDYALRKLGHPVTEINVDRQQCEDRLDDALELFQERHFDGAEKAFFSHKITEDDIANGYISTNDLGPINGPAGDAPTGKDILSVVSVFQFGDFSNINLFDVRYQMALTDYFGINRGLGMNASLGLASYDSTKRHIGLIQDFFQPQRRIRFNKVSNRLHVDMDWSREVTSSEYLMVEAYVALNPNIFTEIFNDRLLKEYIVALIKRQWGQNLSKFEGVQLPGGVSLRGDAIMSEAVEEIRQIEEKFQLEYEEPIDFMTG